MKTSSLLTLVALLMLTLGCEVPEVDNSVATTTTEAEETKPAAEPNSSRVPDTTVEHPEWYLADGRLDMSGVPGEPPMTTSIPREVQPKDPKQGKLTRRRGGKLLGSSLQALPWAKNKPMFDMIKYNLNIYDASTGHFPKSHEEFMEVYLPQYYPAALPLPELEAGDEYLYDPDDHLLKIYRPEE